MYKILITVANPNGITSVLADYDSREQAEIAFDRMIEESKTSYNNIKVYKLY